MLWKALYFGGLNQTNIYIYITKPAIINIFYGLYYWLYDIGENLMNKLLMNNSHLDIVTATDDGNILMSIRCYIL